MYKTGICGHLGIGHNLLNGQTIKTKAVAEELRRRLGEGELIIVDTYGGIKSVHRMLYQSWNMFRKCENIIMMPAHKGLIVFTPVFVFYNCFFHRRLIYIVIGGWLDSFLNRNRWLVGMLKRFSDIYVETSTMKKALELRGFQNVEVMPNFKSLPLIREEELALYHAAPYKICTFSRVVKEKGIEDAIKVVKKVNMDRKKTVFKLDIYGPVDAEYKERFEKLCRDFPEYIRYRGAVAPEESVAVLKAYFALIFPTQYYTEGIPGTIIDAYAAGTPVIASQWESFSDVIEPGLTGIGYEFKNVMDLERVLIHIALYPEVIVAMKKNCLNKAKKFLPETAVRMMVDKMMKHNAGGGIAHKIKGLTILSFAQPAPTLQVLVAAVDQKDAALPRTLNLQSDAIIGNQCDRNSIEVMDYNGHEIIYLNFKERGVGLNRNNAFMRASADIVLFADDDMRYVAHYPDIVRKAFAAYPDADVILFNLI